MVHSRVGAPTRLALALAALIAAALALVPAAGAANRRIAIGDYRWSSDELQLDLGEHVTWYWVGPDTIHSVTGTSANAKGLDSDPETNLPDHPLGDSFQLSFDSPGTYSFACKLHPIVNGTVTVSDSPGDPVSEPDPIPASQVDSRPPRPRGLALSSTKLRRRGARLSFALDERAKLDAEYFRRRPSGRLEYAGYQQWRGLHVGFNDVRFGSPGKHFGGERGRYVAKLVASDRFDNHSRVRKLRFAIVGGAKR